METNPTRNHKVVGSIPDLAQWVKDLSLLWLWCRLAAVALIRPLAWEPPCAVDATLKREKDKKRKERKKKRDWWGQAPCSSVTSSPNTHPKFWLPQAPPTRNSTQLAVGSWGTKAKSHTHQTFLTILSSFKVATSPKESHQRVNLPCTLDGLGRTHSRGKIRKYSVSHREGWLTRPAAHFSYYS